jgi:hypothetical protein
MQIESEANHLVLKDNPGCFWLLGAFFVAAGAFVCLGVAGLFSNADELMLLERLFAILVGIASIIAGAYMILRAPSSRVDFDIERRVAVIKRRRLFYSKIIRLPFEEIYGFAVDEKRHSDDSAVYRAAVVLDGGQVVPLSELWLNDRTWVKLTIHQVSQTLAGAAGSK